MAFNNFNDLQHALPTPATTPATDNAQHERNDPFWHSTPRTNTTNPPNVAEFVAAMKTAAPTTNRVPKAQKSNTRCTHTTMGRIYGNHLFCDLCSKKPETKWLYTCQQDHQLVQPLPHVAFLQAQLDAIPNDADVFEAKALLAETLQMQTCIITSIRAKEYTSEQVTRLIKQKVETIRAVKKAERMIPRLPAHFRVSNDPAGNLITQHGFTPFKSIITSPGTSPAKALQSGDIGILPFVRVNIPSDSPASKSSTSTSPSPQRAVASGFPRCSLQVCVTCKPYFRDRKWASFEAAYNDELPPLTVEGLEDLPIIDPKIARNLGLRQPPVPHNNSLSTDQSVDLTLQESHDTDEISVNWSPTDTEEEETSRSNSSSIENISPTASRSPSDLYPCPGPHHCPVCSRHSGCAYDSGFEDGRRAANHGYMPELESTDLSSAGNSSPSFRFLVEDPLSYDGSSSSASSVSLPTPHTTTKGGTVGLAPHLHDDEYSEAFNNVTLRKQLSSTKAQSAELLTQDNIGLRLRDRSRDSRGSWSSGSEGSEVEVDGGVALTEEAVVKGVPDLRVGECQAFVGDGSDEEY
ncbi:uncharacterized protein MYCGRDRAFT_108274 [Zymoseptoria tritici IPO323]|uniref:Uncharacterized protein n=1 Tax=Zymoseptoria tritici (strain CBS 115943 / IPO323) TaxID=336722 RepID=F9X350_ZYMTI|nr:uncharacterized protein MYCGRDRAFT_108274 [Zymoseptoria tritici IPO323]EGP90322.1 hypothetical protein MYCGRDRAFT_108274 [Zymoseptoria tritici IPO323]